MGGHRMLYLWVEAPYRDSYSWYERYEIIKKISRSKRIDIIEIKTMQDVPTEDPSPVVLIRGASKHSITAAVIEANERGVYPIVIANLPPNTGLHCSVIGANMREDTLRAIDYLEELGCCSLAFFGVNPSPFSDGYRAMVFQSRKPEKDVFFVKNSFEETFDKFFSRAKEYDGVIVTNSATAIALVNELKCREKSGRKMPKVLSFGRIKMMQYYTPGITTISDDINYLGEAVFQLYKLIQRCGSGVEAAVYLPSVITPRKTTDYAWPNNEKFFARYQHTYQENRYFKSERIAEVMLVEKIIQQSDEIDLDIIFGLIRGSTYEQLGERLFMNRNAIDYRVQKIKKIAEKKSVSDLKKLLNQFFG